MQDPALLFKENHAKLGLIYHIFIRKIACNENVNISLQAQNKLVNQKGTLTLSCPVTNANKLIPTNKSLPFVTTSCS